MSFREQLKAKQKANQEAKAQGHANKLVSKRKVPEDYEAPPELDTFTVPAKARDQILALMEQHNAITKRQATLKKLKDGVSDEIKRLCRLYKLSKFQTGGLQTAMYPSNRTTILKELLLAQGVPLIKIIKATKVSESEGLRVSPVSEPTTDDREEQEYGD